MYYIDFFFFFGGQWLTGTDSFIITRVLGGGGVSSTSPFPSRLAQVEAGTMAGEGALGGGMVRRAGGGLEDMMEDPPPSLLLRRRDGVACLSSLSCPRLPISLTTLPHSPESLLLPLTGRGRGRGVFSTSADNPHIIIRGLGCRRYL